ncbi:serine/arginine repetitive matrix protein 1 [Diachasma alloeum]|uniref:serine/arginine repetitive matrix protein 1 n=1 Tax=Diachasma alloeum TaxID=454923 RepID=UPI0007383ADA|nr:serine/arginine repetitive matrix protein 1 [Diachasma alloeum]
MSDLIDLSSPEEKRLRPELPSPLIPSPDNDSPKSTGLNLSDTRRSLDNNPFDMVLRKTSEYVSKSSDPFEIVFERATSKRHSDTLKINKTLDESLLSASHLGTPGAGEIKDHVPSILVEPPSPLNHSILDHSAMNDSFRTFSDRLSMSKNFPGLSGPPGPLEKSILDNSAMNDTLSTSEGSSDDCFIKSLIAQRVSMCIRKGTLDAERLENDNKSIKNPKFRRSFSQGDRLSPRKFRKRSTSIVSDRRNSDYSVPSILFEDPLNLAFMSRERSDYSVISDYSELSNITRVNSINSGSLFSWKSSNDSANRGFIEGSGVGGSRGSEGNFSDLISRFKSLRMKSSAGDEVASIREASPGAPEDEVFLEDEGAKQSIFSQANILARTFEELAEKSTKGSSSSGENLLSTRLPSNFELSPETSATCPTITDASTSHVKSESPQKTPPPNSSDPSKISPEKKKEAAANLLRDLENVIKTEQNPEIMKLLKNLEEALGVKSESNLELLPMHSNPSMQEEKSPTKIPISSTKTTKQVSPREKTINSLNKNQHMAKDSPEDCHKVADKKSLAKIDNKSQKTEENSQRSRPNERKDESSGETPSLEESEASNKSGSMNQESEKSTEDNTEPGMDPHEDNADNLEVNNSTNKSTSKVLPPATESTQRSFTTQKLILDIQLALGKLLEDCRDEPALVLENLNKVLTPKPERHPTSPRKSCLPYRSLKSLGHQLPESQEIVEKSSSKPFPLRRRSSIAQAPEKSRNPEAKGSVSPKKYVNRRNTSDPGIVNVTVEKKQMNVSLKIKSTLPVGDKAKLKKKNDSVGTKKGPMKALVPLGSMQRPGTRAAPGTPPKRHKVPSPLKIATSTPDPSPIVLGKKTTKTKPVASSTPDVGSKDKSSRSHIPQSPKRNMSWNISPVTPNAKGNASSMFGEAEVPQTPKKVEKSLKSSSPLIGGLSRMKDKIIHGRRSEPVRGSPRIEGRGGSKAGGSPLKENNVIKVKALNLTAKFRRRSGSLGNMEKENKFSTPKV